MDEHDVVVAVESLEELLGVTAEVVAAALGVDVEAARTPLDSLVTAGTLRCSILGARLPGGRTFTTKHVWYHSPEREAEQRFGAIFVTPRGIGRLSPRAAGLRTPPPYEASA